MPVDERLVQATLDAWGQAGRVSCLTVQGASMAPLLSPGDRVDVLHGARDLRVGDVVGFRLEGTLVLHRVVLVPDDGTVVTVGDNRSLVDGPVPLEAVIGRVVAVHTARATTSLNSGRARLVGRVVARSLRMRHVRVLRPLVRWLHWGAVRALRV